MNTYSFKKEKTKDCYFFPHLSSFTVPISSSSFCLIARLVGLLRKLSGHDLGKGRPNISVINIIHWEKTQKKKKNEKSVARIEPGLLEKHSATRFFQQKQYISEV
ncbi:hypothetical protein RchiOBHm_Chr5g0075991 [Rosa chinensis]|uniref:Uncharacterized protein n=1 Tax=Rosa chinensis TaxID=74649 RepID=A0A2P6QLP0_ROSCH|nr:hypothetical protein RchiOBHm_Chr5g0075991 [Rosa chinensis]